MNEPAPKSTPPAAPAAPAKPVADSSAAQTEAQAKPPAQEATAQSNVLRAPYHSKTRKQIVGRGIGSKRGRTAKRGTKGHRARSGFKALPFFEGGQMPLSRRLPKVGFTNSPFKKTYEVISLKDIERCFESGAEITRAALVKAGLLKGKRALVKLTNKHKLTTLKKTFTIAVAEVKLTAPAKALLAATNSTLK